MRESVASLRTTDLPEATSSVAGQGCQLENGRRGTTCRPGPSYDGATLDKHRFFAAGHPLSGGAALQRRRASMRVRNDLTMRFSVPAAIRRRCRHRCRWHGKSSKV